MEEQEKQLILKIISDPNFNLDNFISQNPGQIDKTIQNIAEAAIKSVIEKYDSKFKILRNGFVLQNELILELKKYYEQPSENQDEFLESKKRLKEKIENDKILLKTIILQMESSQEGEKSNEQRLMEKGLNIMIKNNINLDSFEQWDLPMLIEKYGLENFIKDLQTENQAVQKILISLKNNQQNCKQQ